MANSKIKNKNNPFMAQNRKRGRPDDPQRPSLE
jgi:hypothetical protein